MSRFESLDVFDLRNRINEARDLKCEKLKSEKSEVSEPSPNWWESEGLLPIQPLSHFEEKEQKWLWYHRIPIGHVTNLEGHGDIGKSFLMVGLAAAVTSGRSFPFDPSPKRPRNVLFLSAEDSPETVIKKRVRENEGNQDRVFALKNSILLTEDGLERLERTVVAGMISLVVIDPAQGFTDLNPDKMHEVRPFLTSLKNIAEKWECSIVLVRHLGKDTGKDTKFRGIGSIDWRNACKGQLQAFFGADGKRYLAQTKNNYSEFKMPTLIWDVVDGEVVFIGESELSAEEIDRASDPKHQKPRNQNETDKACTFLIECLKSGPKPGSLVVTEAESAGITSSSIHRASKQLNVRKEKNVEGWPMNKSIWFLSDFSQAPGFHFSTFHSTRGGKDGNS